MITEEQRQNLDKLATYLESLPADYKHFDMEAYADHRGDCNLGGDGEALILAATKPDEFLHNCGTVACAVGHGPAAGIPYNKPTYSPFSWAMYATDNFCGDSNSLFRYLFGAQWSRLDNTPQGAAARIRCFLAEGWDVIDEFDEPYSTDWHAAMARYAPYLKEAA